MKKTLLSLLAVATAVTAIAQTDPNYDPKAKTILQELSKTIQSYTSITASYSVTIKQPNSTAITKTGTAVLRKNMYKITVDKDAQNKEEYYKNGTTTWVYNSQRNEVTIDCAQKENENSISPSTIFNISEKGFKYKFLKEEVQNGKTVQLLELYPEKPEQRKYHTIKLSIDKNKKQLISFTVLFKDGSSTAYTIKSLTPNLSVNDNTFQFDNAAHPSVKIIDLRVEDPCPEQK